VVNTSWRWAAHAREAGSRPTIWHCAPPRDPEIQLARRQIEFPETSPEAGWGMTGSAAEVIDGESVDAAGVLDRRSDRSP
jgi:hypothetical protein